MSDFRRPRGQDRLPRTRRCRARWESDADGVVWRWRPRGTDRPGRQERKHRLGFRPGTRVSKARSRLQTTTYSPRVSSPRTPRPPATRRCRQMAGKSTLNFGDNTSISLVFRRKWAERARNTGPGSATSSRPGNVVSSGGVQRRVRNGRFSTAAAAGANPETIVTRRRDGSRASPRRPRHSRSTTQRRRRRGRCPRGRRSCGSRRVSSAPQHETDTRRTSATAARDAWGGADTGRTPGTPSDNFEFRSKSDRLLGTRENTMKSTTEPEICGWAGPSSCDPYAIWERCGARRYIGVRARSPRFQECGRRTSSSRACRRRRRP